MKNRFFTGIVMIGMTALVLTGCSKMPQTEIDAAKAAIEEARVAGADLYAPESFTALNDSLNSTMLVIESQNSKFIKNFSSAKEALAGVTVYAAEVKLQAEQKKEEMKQQIETGVQEVTAIIEANRALIAQAPRGKEGTSALKAITAENDAIEAAIAEGVTLMNEGDYLNSHNRVMVARERANAINSELSTVIAKYKANAGR